MARGAVTGDTAPTFPWVPANVKPGTSDREQTARDPGLRTAWAAGEAAKSHRAATMERGDRFASRGDEVPWQRLPRWGGVNWKTQPWAGGSGWGRRLHVRSSTGRRSAFGNISRSGIRRRTT